MEEEKYRRENTVGERRAILVQEIFDENQKLKMALTKYQRLEDIDRVLGVKSRRIEAINIHLASKEKELSKGIVFEDAVDKKIGELVPELEEKAKEFADRRYQEKYKELGKKKIAVDEKERVLEKTNKNFECYKEAEEDKSDKHRLLAYMLLHCRHQRNAKTRFLISEELGMKESSVAEHFRFFKKANLLKNRAEKEGKTCYF